MRVTARFSAALLGLSLVATACGLGAGASRESLVDILIVEGQITREQATCVADALYATPGLTEDKIHSLSVITELKDDANQESRDEFELYQAAVDTAVRLCI